MLAEDGSATRFLLTDYAVELWRARTGVAIGLPKNFVAARDLPIRAHLEMQAALQPFVDNSISKTINVPSDCSFTEFQKIYDFAYNRGLKGCTTFRPNPITGAVLTMQEAPETAPHCCSLEREPD